LGMGTSARTAMDGGSFQLVGAGPAGLI
jgi:hypothetical protein